ncbi:methyltransferase [Saccharomonospora sp. CUA-673]|uniref:class I SAM-dependent methyltransferase n=1 Tax=Saccharomonospora sp. CUA-673 TaxID=1904969 RepID=UPI000967AD6A|nr:class I SAM-dependent methyltransferase [Saccharomonospora sp. CUA-673]OLT49171.1 methyltransferase [Saccharomonospora sp. CUA-673]
MTQDAGAHQEPAWLLRTRTSYDIDASGYAERVHGLLGARSDLRAHLDVFAEFVRRDGGGPIVDVGCGPGYVARYLHDAGVETFGIDLAPEMVTIARRDHPHIHFRQGTMTDLDLEDRSVGGVVAFWSTIHIPDDSMPHVAGEFFRVLRPNGCVLIGFHVGDAIQHSSTGYTGAPISVDTHRRRPGTMSDWLREAGFRIEWESLLRPDDESPGALVLARRP